MSFDYVADICKKVAFPFKPWYYQHDEVNRLVIESIDRSALYWDMGAGKTAGSTLHSMIYRDQCGAQIWLMVPPVLLKQWSRWLTRCGITNKVYYGTIAQRKTITLDPDTAYFITTTAIVKNDFDRIRDSLANRKIMVSVDEATSLKNFESGNFRAVLQLSSGQAVQPMTGSPLSTPRDAYAYIKLVSPRIYRSFTQFENIHVAKTDHFGRPTEWKNLEMLATNLGLHASFISTPEVHPDMPRALIQPVEYDLDTQHKALYRRLVDDRLLVYESGFAIDVTTASKLHHAVQQVVLNNAYFGQDASLKPAGFDLLDEFLLELRTKKVIIVATYKMSVRLIMQYLLSKGIKAVQVNGDISKKLKDDNIEAFKLDPTLQACVINPQSGGVGTDGFQEVCNHMIFMEVPTLSREFYQVVKRIERPGQPFICDIRVATALGTVQVHLRKQLSDNNVLVKQLVPSTSDLRAQLMGQT